MSYDGNSYVVASNTPLDYVNLRVRFASRCERGTLGRVRLGSQPSILSEHYDGLSLKT